MKYLCATCLALPLVLAAATRSRAAQALYVCGDALVDALRARINTLALRARLPTIYPNREYLQAGGLMSYGATVPARL
jgi:putative ABC transport system substrate-binding protein